MPQIYGPLVLPLLIIFCITSIETVGDVTATEVRPRTRHACLPARSTRRGTGSDGQRHMMCAGRAGQRQPARLPLPRLHSYCPAPLRRLQEASFLSTTGPGHEKRIRGALLNDGISSIFSALVGGWCGGHITTSGSASAAAAAAAVAAAAAAAAAQRLCCAAWPCTHAVSGPRRVAARPARHPDTNRLSPVPARRPPPPAAGHLPAPHHLCPEQRRHLPHRRGLPPGRLGM